MTEATEPQRYAARMAATGVMPKTIAKSLGIALATVNAWAKQDWFLELRNHFSKTIEEALEEDLIGASAEMLSLWRCWLRGEVKADDARIPIVAPTLLRWTEGYFAIANNPPNSKGSPGPTIQILNNPGPPAPRLRTALIEEGEDTLSDVVRSLPKPGEDRVGRQKPPRRDPVQAL